MKDTGEYNGNYYRVHECVAQLFSSNRKMFNSLDGSRASFITIAKYLNNLCMDDDGMIHATKCPRMNGKEKHELHIQPVEVSPVEIEWVEDEVAKELNYREDDGGNACSE